MNTCQERHQREQYFFDGPTLAELADLVERFERPCLLCAPMLGEELHRRGRDVCVLDVDRRFRHLPGFVEWDLTAPRRLGEEFDLILCDPPFFQVPLSTLFDSVRVLCRYDFTRPVMVSYLVRRQFALLGAFVPLGLGPTGYRPRYASVQPCEPSEVEFFANFDLDVPSPAPPRGQGACAPGPAGALERKEVVIC